MGLQVKLPVSCGHGESVIAACAGEQWCSVHRQCTWCSLASFSMPVPHHAYPQPRAHLERVLQVLDLLLLLVVSRLLVSRAQLCEGAQAEGAEVVEGGGVAAQAAQAEGRRNGTREGAGEGSPAAEARHLPVGREGDMGGARGVCAR